MPTEQKRVSVSQVAATVLIVLAMIVLLRFEGRMFLCSCGYFVPWISDTCSSNTSQQLFDPYSFTHILHGFLFFWLIALLFRRVVPGWQFGIALLLEAA